MKLLLHICCGPCASAPLYQLLEQGHDVTGFFYNPNIHPYTENQKRLDSVKILAEKTGIKLIVFDQYDLEQFLRNTVFREEMRCGFCYEMRLAEAAKVAKKGHFEAFTSSLLISPMQKHELIRSVGENLGKAYDVPFYYEDFRPLYPKSVTLSKELGLYRQQYCGCIYSEKERYLGKKKKGEPS